MTKNSTVATPPQNTGTELERILVVDDNEMLVRLCETVLSRSGYPVMAATHPKEALALVEQSDQKPTILVTDVVMPEMNGVEMASQLGQKIDGLKILLISGYSDQVLKKEGTDPKNFAFLAKPFTGAALLEEIKKLKNS